MGLTNRINEMIKNGNNMNQQNKYNNLLNNGDDIEDYSEDDLENDNMEKYDKYVPPSVKHIHENSTQVPNGMIDGNDADKLYNLEKKVKEQDTTIDNYISTVNRKDR